MVYYKYEFNAKEDSNGEIEEEQKRCKTYRKCQMYLKGRAWWNGKKNDITIHFTFKDTL